MYLLFFRFSLTKPFLLFQLQKTNLKLTKQQSLFWDQFLTDSTLWMLRIVILTSTCMMSIVNLWPKRCKKLHMMWYILASVQVDIVDDDEFQIHLLYVWNPKFRLQLDLTLTDYSFDYTLSAIFVYESLEKGFSQIKRGSGKIYSSTLEISRQLLKARTSSCLWKLTFICSHVRIFLPC